MASLKDRPDVFFGKVDDIINQSRSITQGRLNLYKSIGRNTTGIQDLIDRFEGKNTGSEVYGAKGSSNKPGSSFTLRNGDSVVLQF
jgi:hypothetical protein